VKILLGILFFGLAASGRTEGQTVETIVCVRHGEKPAGGLGQLTCRGLNRALALPKVLLAKYGRPQFIFAPNPTRKAEGNGNYNYIRPLMTIEPTAVQCGLPVDTQFDYEDIASLERELQKQEYQNATIFIAWEHVLLDKMAKALLQAHGANPAQVPAWPGKDFDSIFLIKISRAGTNEMVTFSIDHEGLNGVSDACP
jgi:hypothetical protein